MFFCILVMCVVFIVIVFLLFFFFVKQKPAYEMRIRDWSSDVCYSDLKTADHLVGELARRFSATLDTVLPSGKLALVDFPDHSNVGDSAIWLGEMAYLRSQGRLPVYYSAIADFDDADCRAATGGGDRKSTRLNSRH